MLHEYSALFYKLGAGLQSSWGQTPVYHSAVLHTSNNSYVRRGAQSLLLHCKIGPSSRPDRARNCLLQNDIFLRSPSVLCLCMTCLSFSSVFKSSKLSLSNSDNGKMPCPMHVCFCQRVTTCRAPWNVCLQNSTTGITVKVNCSKTV